VGEHLPIFHFDVGDQPAPRVKDLDGLHAAVAQVADQQLLEGLQIAHQERADAGGSHAAGEVLGAGIEHPGDGGRLLQGGRCAIHQQHRAQQGHDGQREAPLEAAGDAADEG